MKDIKHIAKKTAILFFFMYMCSSHAQNTFVENKGQFPENVISKTYLPSGALFMEKAKFTYAFYDGKQLQEKHDGESTKESIDAHSYKVSFLNINNNSSYKLTGESEYYENYFIGGRKNWATKVRSYKTHLQKDIYSGIDLLLFVVNDQLKFELHVAPKKNTKQIKLKYEGLEKLQIIGEDILCKTSVNLVKEHKPYAYQIINGKTVEVECNYKLRKNIISFYFPNSYNKNYELVIDPVLEFSTYSGSTADNFGYTATYDNFGFLYSGSTVFGVGYPTTLGAYDISYNNTLGTDVSITKYDTSGTQRVYSTYLGGVKDELPHSMIVNSADELFIFGTTASADFPTTLSAYQNTFKGGTGFSPSGIGVSFPEGSDIFVSRLSASGGALLASTFIGGTENDGVNTASKLKYNYADEVRGEIDIDKNNNIYIATCTQSLDFPITNSFQNNSNGNQEGCIVKMDNQLTSIIWSSYLGGENDDAIYSLAIDDDNNIYVTGGTNSPDFPTTTNSYLSAYQDSINADAFISKISSNGTQLMHSSYYGTDEYDQSYFVEIGGNKSVYLFGQTKTPAIDLVSNANYFESGAGQFIAVFAEDLSTILRSTVVGTGKGTPDISPTAFLVDVCDKIYISGWGSNISGGPLSTLNLPVSTNAYQQNTDGNDFYLMVIDDEMNSMLYATYFGGTQSNEHVDGGTSRFDKKGIIYQSVCAGCGGNSDFPIEPNPGAVSTTNNSLNCNNGVFKFNFDFPLAIADFNAPWVGCDQSIVFQNLSNSTSSVNYYWDFGDGITSTLQNPTHNFTQTGQHNVTLIVNDTGSCNMSDTIVKQIYILSNSTDTIQELTKCIEEQIQIGLLPVNDPTINYFWSPPIDLSSTNVSNPISTTAASIEYQLLISSGGCTDTLSQKINVVDFQLDAGPDTSYCNSPIELIASYTSEATSVVWSTNIEFIDTLSQSSSIIVEGTGVFYVKVSNGICKQIDSVEVHTKNLNILLFADDVCNGSSVLVGVANQTPRIPILYYNWNLFSGNSSSIIDYPDSSRWYSVEVVDLEGCILKDSIFVNVYENPTIDSLWLNKDVVFQGEQVMINIQTNDSVNWIGYNNYNLTLADYPAQNTCYNVQVYNQFNCIIYDSICVTVLDVFCNEDSILIPTAFSPNEDDNFLNETYFIKDNSAVITDFNLEIFNRLGQKVFSSTDINIKWDGTYKGKKLTPQVLDFYLELKCIGDKKLFKKGNITLIR